MKSEAIFIRMTPALKEKLQKLADKDKRTLSDYVRIVLEGHIEKYDK